MARLKAILTGAGRLFDFRGNSSESKRREVEKLRHAFANRSDAQALASDWAKVGDDIRMAISKHVSR